MRLKTILLLLLGLSVLTFVGCSNQAKEDPASKFPRKLNTRVELRQSEDSIQYRFIKLAEDGSEKPIQIQTEFRDGISVLDNFRGDGTLSEKTEYYPSDSDQAQDLADRVLKRTAQYDEGGRRVIASKSYRLDGTLEVSTRIRADKSTETEKYSLDGTVILARQVKDKYGLVVVRELFRENGTLASVVREKDKYESHLVEYREDGFTRKSLTVRKSSRSNGYGYSSSYENVEYILYQDDGLTLAMKVEFPWSSRTDVSYYGPAGNLLEEREYSEYGSFKLTAYWPNGEKRFVQVYHGPGYRADRMDISKFKLDEVEEFDFTGEKVREVSFYDNGNAKQVQEFDGKNSYCGIIRKYRDDGTLESEKEVTDYLEYGEEKTFEAEEGIKADLPKELLTIEERQKPPAKEDLPKYDRNAEI